VAKVTTSGTITEYPVPTANSGPYFIAAGSDGSLWFTEIRADKVAKMTTSGTITEYPIPTPNSEPAGIAAGPDDNMWFTELGVFTPLGASANNVAKVGTGVVPTPALPTAAEQCKKHGWQSYGVFQNQGDCVSYVASGGKNLPGS
jgi:hypothetical protein